MSKKHSLWCRPSLQLTVSDQNATISSSIPDPTQSSASTSSKKLPALRALLLESSFDFVLLHLPSLLAPPGGHLKRWAFARRRPTWLIIFLLDPEVRVCTTRLLYHRRTANLDDAHCMIEVLAPHRWSWAPSIIHYQPPPQPLLGSSGQPYNQLFPHPAA